jgi:hypothetical protein
MEKGGIEVEVCRLLEGTRLTDEGDGWNVTRAGVGTLPSPKQVKWQTVAKLKVISTVELPSLASIDLRDKRSLPSIRARFISLKLSKNIMSYLLSPRKVLQRS